MRAARRRAGASIRDRARALDETRAEASELDVARATAESDLGHLAQTCVDTVQVTLDEVLVDVEALEQAGQAVPDAAAMAAEEPDPTPRPTTARVERAAAEAEPAPVAAAAPAPRLDDGRGSHRPAAREDRAARAGEHDGHRAVRRARDAATSFLTTQRQDLVESIAQTSEAIKRIDETTSARFTEAFTAIQPNFQETFSTLFGGGRAGLALLDENDPLESGIDIVASPPGKRLQSVQLLSGGEKALTAIALMFAIFQYKPSPFCLLDEIDAPLDDANVGRFVEMLRGMLDRTQFILITHNRRTMEIANRLYGVTMEEPGVSKLISVHLH